MNTITALQQRKSVRSFQDKHVDTETINAILSAASCAPSGANTQPWQVAVVSGETKKSIQTKIENNFRQGQHGNADYQYYPKSWHNPYKIRRIQCGRLMYNTLDIGRQDKQRRLDQWAANYRAFDAPVMLLFFLDKILFPGSFLDYGMFLQSIMLAAIDKGLATCPQASLSEYPEIIKSALGYPDDTILVGGMALGYEDKGARVNRYRTPRENISSFTRYFS